jgi:uncharacterized protein DUF2569
MMAEATSIGQEPSGLGGWLLLPIFHLFLDAFIVLVGILQAITLDQPPTNNESRLAMVVYILVSTAIGIFAAYCTVHIFRKKKDVPALMSQFYLLIFGKIAASAALLHLFPDVQIPPASIGGIFAAAISTIIWIAYFKQSVRVRNTFVN